MYVQIKPFRSAFSTSRIGIVHNVRMRLCFRLCFAKTVTVIPAPVSLGVLSFSNAYIHQQLINLLNKLESLDQTLFSSLSENLLARVVRNVSTCFPLHKKTLDFSWTQKQK